MCTRIRGDREYQCPRFDVFSDAPYVGKLINYLCSRARDRIAISKSSNRRKISATVKLTRKSPFSVAGLSAEPQPAAPDGPAGAPAGFQQEVLTSDSRRRRVRFDSELAAKTRLYVDARFETKESNLDDRHENADPALDIRVYLWSARILTKV